MRSSKTHQHLGVKQMGKFKERVTNEMTTKNVTMETAVTNLQSANQALLDAERAVRRAFTSEKLDAMWDKSCKDKFNEMNATKRGRHFIAKFGSPLNDIGNRPKVRF